MRYGRRACAGLARPVRLDMSVCNTRQVLVVAELGGPVRAGRGLADPLMTVNAPHKASIYPFF